MEKEAFQPNKEDYAVEFKDPKEYLKINPDFIKLFKQKLAERGIIVNDREAMKIAQAVNDLEFSEPFNTESDTEH